MNAVHPTLALVLNSMCPPQAEPVTPPCHHGPYEYVHDTDIGELTCWFDHQPAERQTHWEPGCAEALNLTHVWLLDLEISDRICDDIKEEMEAAALEALISERAQALYDQLESRDYE